MADNQPTGSATCSHYRHMLPVRIMHSVKVLWPAVHEWHSGIPEDDPNNPAGRRS